MDIGIYLVAQEATERACRNEGIFSLDHLRVFDEAGRGGRNRQKGNMNLSRVLPPYLVPCYFTLSEL